MHVFYTSVTCGMQLHTMLLRGSITNIVKKTKTKNNNKKQQNKNNKKNPVVLSIKIPKRQPKIFSCFHNMFNDIWYWQ